MFSDLQPARFSHRNANSLRSANPLSEDQIRRIAPSIFAEDKHNSRSDRYTYIPTIDVLRGLRNEGFEPFMVAQTRTLSEDKREFAKHMIRMRRADQINARETNEIVLLNSHDGSSSYQILAGVYRQICSNGMVAAKTVNDIRIPHKGNVVDQVIEGAFRVVDDFVQIEESKDSMKAVTLSEEEQAIFGRAALLVKYDDPTKPAPVTADDILRPRRFEDVKSDLWVTFNRVQENMVKGGLHGRTATGRPTKTREIKGVDQDIKVNRALWALAEEMARLKA